MICESSAYQDPTNSTLWHNVAQTINLLVDISNGLGRHIDAVRYSEKLVNVRRNQAIESAANSKLAEALGSLSWYYVLNRQFSEAKTAGEEGYSLDHQKNWILLNVAYAEMFLGHTEAAMKLHVEHLDDVMPDNGNKRWREVIADDFAALKKAGLENPTMIIIEKLMANNSPADNQPEGPKPF